MLGQHVEPAVPPQRSRAPGGPGTPRWLSGGPIYLAVTEALRAPGKIPGCSGTRNLHDNLSDLRAQVAANQKGIQLVGELIGQYGLDVVHSDAHPHGLIRFIALCVFFSLCTFVSVM